MDEERVAGKDRLAELHLVGTHEVADFARVLGLPHHHDRGDLSHGLDLQHARHDGVPGEVTLEVGLVDRDAFDADGLEVSVKLHNAVHHQEGIAVRQDIHHPVDIHHG